MKALSLMRWQDDAIDICMNPIFSDD